MIYLVKSFIILILFNGKLVLQKVDDKQLR